MMDDYEEVDLDDYEQHEESLREIERSV